MSGTQVTNGKAFEYALATAYSTYLQEKGVYLELVKNDAYKNAEKFYNLIAFVECKGFYYCAVNSTYMENFHRRTKIQFFLPLVR